MNKIKSHFFSKSTFPFKICDPIKAEILIDIDGTKFTDCVEVSIRHFFFMIQPIEFYLITTFWDETNSPLKESIKDYFHSHGPKTANDEDSSLRQEWAKIVSRIPGVKYKKKTNQSLLNNDIEIKAGWFNYLKAISYLKNDQDSWNELCQCIDVLSEKKNKITPEIKKSACKIFSKLAGSKLKRATWCHNDDCEGIRDMEDGSLDLLGKIRCEFYETSKRINFVMMNGHGYVQWRIYD